jgi:hypothetical protein
MGVFRFDYNYAAPTKQQRERYMKGETEELHFGPDGQIVLILYPEAAYLKDDIDGVGSSSPASRINRRCRTR